MENSAKIRPVSSNNLLSVPEFTANLYCIWLSIAQIILKRMQYRFAVNFEILSKAVPVVVTGFHPDGGDIFQEYGTKLHKKEQNAGK